MNWTHDEERGEEVNEELPVAPEGGLVLGVEEEVANAGCTEEPVVAAVEGHANYGHCAVAEAVHKQSLQLPLHEVPHAQPQSHAAHSSSSKRIPEPPSAAAPKNLSWAPVVGLSCSKRIHKTASLWAFAAAKE